jgi:magnesium chelatase family protein
MSLDGLNGYLVEIQSDVAGGLPNFEIVGLPDIRVKEAKERVRTAIKNSNIDFPSRKIIVNLAPADKRKEGTHLDLPIAIGILIAMGEIRKIKIENFESTIFLGELSLDGSINWVNGILPMCIEAKNLGIKRVILPTENVMEASIVKDLDIIPVNNLLDVIKYLKDEKKIERHIKQNLNLENIDNYNIDFSEVKGQENAKRALEIAVAGMHNCLLIGPPGAGKSLLAERIVTIMPDLTFKEALEITKIHSISGEKECINGLINKRPFRNPNHTSSETAIMGGRKKSKARGNKFSTFRSIVFRRTSRV